jgi:hypothetical protein
MTTRLEEIAEKVHETLDDPSVKRLHGWPALSEHAARRRAVWCSTGGTIEEPRQGGGRRPTGETDTSEAQTARIVACKIRVEDVQIHIYGETAEVTEQLLDNLIAAIYITLGTPMIPNYRWVSQQTETSGRTLRNEKIVLFLKLRLPVPEEISPLRKIEGITFSAVLLDDEGNFPDSPNDDPITGVVP